MCHPNRDPGETMGIAAASVCMQCHSTIKADSPQIQKLAEFAKSSRPIRWARVTRFRRTLTSVIGRTSRLEIRVRSAMARLPKGTFSLVKATSP